MRFDFNFRKILDLFSLLSFCIVIYIGFFFPEKLIDYFVLILIFLVLCDLIYYTLEYIYLIYPKKVNLWKIRVHYNLDFLVRHILFGLLFTAIIINWSKVVANDKMEWLLLLLIFIKGLIYERLKNSIRISDDRILFNGLLEKDILIKEIKKVVVDSKKQRIKFVLFLDHTQAVRPNLEFL
jgi:hypothetical protein